MTTGTAIPASGHAHPVDSNGQFPDREMILDFFEIVYGAEPLPGKIAICDRNLSRCDDDPAGEFRTNGFRETIQEAAELAANCAETTCTWFGIGLVRRDKTTGRGEFNDIVALPGLWFEVDYGKPGAPPDKQAALDVVHSLPFQPTMIVHTGHGLHGYLLFSELFELSGPADRENASDILQGVRSVLNLELRRRGFKNADSIFDLPRVFRPVGTQNWKDRSNRLPVTVLEVNESQRYLPEDFERFIPEPAPQEHREPKRATDDPFWEVRPGDDFNNRGTWPDVAKAIGWTCKPRRGANGWELLRCECEKYGKPSSSFTGKTGHNGSDRITIFSGNCGLKCDPDEQGRRPSYSKFELLAEVRFGNYTEGERYTEAASFLAAHGFGIKRPIIEFNATAKGWAQHDEQETDEEFAERSVADPGELPDGFCQVPGLLGEIIGWNLATAHMPQPQLALGGGIALMGAITGRKITDRMGTRTNVNCVGLAPTGRGKDHARKVNKAVLQYANMHETIGPESIGSSAGLESVVFNKPEILIQLDEIGRFLATVGNPNASPHLFSIITVMLKMFSSSNSLYCGPAYADLKKVRQIEQPHLCLYGTTVAKSFLDSLSTESLTDGFVGRLLVFEGTSKVIEPDDDREVAEFVPPESIIKAVHYWREYKPAGLIGESLPRPRILKDSDDARAMFKKLSDIALGFPVDSVKSAIWARAHEKARKLALIYSVSEDCIATKISGDAAEWAIGIVTHLTRRLEYLADRFVADSAFGKQSNRVFEIIDSAGPSGIGRNALCHKTRWLRTKELDEILEALRQQGKVSCAEANTKGRKKHVSTSTRHLRANT